MSLNAVKMLGIKITNSSKKEILEEVQKYLDSGEKNSQKGTKKTIKPLVIATPNPEQVIFAQQNSHFRDLINRVDIAIPDGVGIVWASSILASKGQKNSVSVIEKTVPGIEFMQELVSFAVKRSINTALIGGRDKVALEAFECLAKKYPGLRAPNQNKFGTGYSLAEDGPDIQFANDELRMPKDKDYFKKLAHRIADAKIQLVFVGLGAPKQEFFIEKLVQELSMINNQLPTVFMSVGGSFDVISGKFSRAPSWVRSIGFEWLWRLALEPWRIKRQFALLQFIFLVLKERLSLK